MSSNLFDDEEDRSSGGCGGYGGEGGYEDGKREGRYKRLVDTMVVGVVIRKVEVVVVRWRWLWIHEWKLWWLWI
ncbi:hypothetical protein F2Q70_00026464 [Brassica cretica]|uniref:Uncharacterized protein n=1 Tax=Brassica cretica TaxID=69181 RepID=A0A8S9IHE2_BRACR|nr:hypothetical protein F2Q68_00026032 [Brassica cretica]KAF2601355.1 hypothetical protein F2Q70_00026464 [Brassica cretica]